MEKYLCNRITRDVSAACRAGQMDTEAILECEHKKDSMVNKGVNITFRKMSKNRLLLQGKLFITILANQSLGLVECLV